MQRLSWLPLALLLAGCAEDTFSQTGGASASCSGFIVLGCNATQRNSIMPSPDEAMALALALAILAVILFVVYLVRNAQGG